MIPITELIDALIAAVREDGDVDAARRALLEAYIDPLRWIRTMHGWITKPPTVK